MATTDGGSPFDGDPETFLDGGGPDDDSGSPYPGLCWAVTVAPCWAEEWAGFDADVKAYAAEQAVETLRMLTGYRVGNCPVTVRPCREGCSEPRTWATFPAGSGDGSGASAPVVGFQPAMVSGDWINLACGCRRNDCSCTSFSEIVLPTTIGAITSIYLDGDELDPSAYRVDNHRRIVRTDGDDWPLCQDMEADLTQPNTLGVTYTPGSVPGRLGEGAAGHLAVEYARACTSNKCALPTGVQSIARAGLTITVATGAFPDGLTGIRDVDSFIQRHNPNRLTGPPTVWSPDVRHPRRTTIGG